MVELLNTLLGIPGHLCGGFCSKCRPDLRSAHMGCARDTCVERGLATKSLRRKGSQSLSLCGFVTSCLCGKNRATHQHAPHPKLEFSQLRFDFPVLLHHVD